MGFSEKMLEGMMGGMKPEKMQELMDQVFTLISPEDKLKLMNGMMEKLMGSLSPEVMQDMMQKMMGKLMGGLSGGFMGITGKAASLAADAPAELHKLFEEWLDRINDEVSGIIKQEGTADPAALAEKFKLNKESIHFILGKLAQSGKINIKAEQA